VSSAAYLNLRVFLEGVEVPAIGARIVATAGVPIACEVRLVATDPIFDLKPRTAVAVCVFDDDRRGHSYEGGTQKERANLTLADLRNYKCGFLGELAGVNFQKQPGQRDVTLVFLAPDNYWDFIKQHYVNFRNGGIELIELAFRGVSPDKAKSFDVAGKDLHSNLFNWLSKSENAEGNDNLYLGVHRTLREMWFAANDWYGGAFNRWRYGDLVVGVPQDETAAKLFKLDFFQKYLSNRVGGGGGAYTLAQMMRMMLGTVFHDTVGIPFPYLDKEGRARGYDPDDGSALSRRLIKRDDGWADATLNYTAIVPHAPFMAPPVCNIVFPNQYNIVSHNRDFLNEPTRMFVRTSLLLNGAPNKWLTERFYAPDFDSLDGMTVNAKNGSFLERMATTVLPHERWTGLNPVEHWQDDLSAYVAKGPRRDYLSKLADYSFWLGRFARRTMSFTGPLNLNLVPGFPAVLMSDVYSPLHMAKHIFGHMHTVVHMIDQRGGITQGTITHARHHTEVLDFDSDASTLSDDGTGADYRSLSTLVDRGTDGFLDDRYDVKRVGAEVYDLLLGCESLYDLGERLADQVDTEAAEANVPLVVGGDKFWKDIDGDKHPLRRAIWALEIAWRLQNAEGGDLRSMAQEVTWRPKASLVEVLGHPDATDSANDTDLDLTDVYDEEGIPAEGFLSSAFDPGSFAAKPAADGGGDGYKGVDFTTRTRKTVKVRRTLPAGETIVDANGKTIGPSDRDLQYDAQSTTETAVEHEVDASYNLQESGLIRRQCVQDYVKSLELRGLG